MGGEAAAPGVLRPPEHTFQACRLEVSNECPPAPYLRAIQQRSKALSAQGRATRQLKQCARARLTRKRQKTRSATEFGSRRAHQPIASVGSVRNLKRHLSTPPASARRWRGRGIFPAIRHRVAARCHAPPGAFLDRDAARKKGEFTFPCAYSRGGQCAKRRICVALGAPECGKSYLVSCKCSLDDVPHHMCDGR